MADTQGIYATKYAADDLRYAAGKVKNGKGLGRIPTGRPWKLQRSSRSVGDQSQNGFDASKSTSTASEVGAKVDWDINPISAVAKEPRTKAPKIPGQRGLRGSPPPPPTEIKDPPVEEPPVKEPEKITDPPVKDPPVKEPEKIKDPPPQPQGGELATIRETGTDVDGPIHDAELVDQLEIEGPKEKKRTYPHWGDKGIGPGKTTDPGQLAPGRVREMLEAAGRQGIAGSPTRDAIGGREVPGAIEAAQRQGEIGRRKSPFGLIDGRRAAFGVITGSPTRDAIAGSPTGEEVTSRRAQVGELPRFPHFLGMGREGVGEGVNNLPGHASPSGLVDRYNPTKRTTAFSSPQAQADYYETRMQAKEPNMAWFSGGSKGHYEQVDPRADTQSNTPVDATRHDLKAMIVGEGTGVAGDKLAERIGKYTKPMMDNISASLAEKGRRAKPGLKRAAEFGAALQDPHGMRRH